MKLKENKIYNMEAIKFLKRIPDESIDLILTDPPYNISKLNNDTDKSKLRILKLRRKKPIKRYFGAWDMKERREFLRFTKSWLYECCRTLKDGGTIISFFSKEDINFLGWTGKRYNIRSRTIMTWHKRNCAPSIRKRDYLSTCEFIWIGSKGKKPWTFNFKRQKEMHNFYESLNRSIYGQTIHPNEKPLKLIRHLIEIHSNPEDLILDCFVGSGTTAIASNELKRNFIGCELDKEYYDIAVKRFETAKKQTKISNKNYLNKFLCKEIK